MYIYCPRVLIISNIFVNKNENVQLQEKYVIIIKDNPIPNLSRRFLVQHYTHPAPKKKAFLDESLGGPSE